MSSDIAIKIENLSKCYQIYDTPRDRLKQFIYPKAKGLIAPVGRLLGSNSPLATRLLPRNYYKEFWALKDVSFEVKKGETVGIIGRNGSGKSTLLQMICGTLTPTNGSVQTNGRIAALLELGAGFNPEFTGRENVYMNATVLGLSQAEIDARFDDIAAFADIGDFIEQPVKCYSSGMYARLAFAVAISVDPNILVVDEALAVGDEPFQRKCFARIEEIKRNGGTILFVSHSSQAIVDLCDRAVLLFGGERLFTGEPKKAVSWYQKLMNAHPDLAAGICAYIIREDVVGDGGESASRESQSGLGNKSLPMGAEEVDAQRELEPLQFYGQEADYDASLVSKSLVAYETNGAVISNPRILTLDDRIVNCLVSGERYRLCYDVEFNIDCAGVQFYNAIKTISGIELGGGGYPALINECIEINAGKKVTINFEFQCTLNQGTYFFNCGLSGNGGQSLHRLIDALPFRVRPKEGLSHSFGNVDFGYAIVLQPSFICRGPLSYEQKP